MKNKKFEKNSLLMKKGLLFSNLYSLILYLLINEMFFNISFFLPLFLLLYKEDL